MQKKERKRVTVAGNVKWKRFQPFREPQARIVASHSFANAVPSKIPTHQATNSCVHYICLYHLLGMQMKKLRPDLTRVCGNYRSRPCTNNAFPRLIYT